MAGGGAALLPWYHFRTNDVDTFATGNAAGVVANAAGDLALIPLKQGLYQISIWVFWQGFGYVHESSIVLNGSVITEYQHLSRPEVDSAPAAAPAGLWGRADWTETILTPPFTTVSVYCANFAGAAFPHNVESGTLVAWYRGPVAGGFGTSVY